MEANIDCSRNISTSRASVPFPTIKDNKFLLFVMKAYVDQLTFYHNAVAEGPPPPSGRIIIQSPPATASRVIGNLWQGDAPPIGPYIGRYFDCLVLSAIEYPLGPECFPGVEVIRIGLTDHGPPISWNEMQLAVKIAGQVINRLQQNKRVLVTCHAGLNRSGLINALALCCGPKRIKPDQAIQLIRKARGPNALSNRSFREFLSAFYAGRVTAPKL